MNRRFFLRTVAAAVGGGVAGKLGIPMVKVPALVPLAAPVYVPPVAPFSPEIWSKLLIDRFSTPSILATLCDSTDGEPVTIRTTPDIDIIEVGTSLDMTLEDLSDELYDKGIRNPRFLIS